MVKYESSKAYSKKRIEHKNTPNGELFYLNDY